MADSFANQGVTHAMARCKLESISIAQRRKGGLESHEDTGESTSIESGEHANPQCSSRQVGAANWKERERERVDGADRTSKPA